ncbi:MAG: hypothetical protein ABJE63_08845 [Lentilitoribacter sp.]
MPTLWIFDIEPHEQRYTSEWQTYLPKQIEGFRQANSRKRWNVQTISTIQTGGKLSQGAFLNFAETNVYKSFQVSAFAKDVELKNVKPGDRLLFTDAWHPGVVQCRYMSDLLNLDLTIDVMWHAGSYDKHDILSQKTKNKRWSFAFEQAIYEAADRNYFATQYHRDLFLLGLKIGPSKKCRIVGWPMEYLPNLLKDRYKTPNKNTIIFPHRISPEKQPDIFRNLQAVLGSHDLVLAQSKPLDKSDYHDLLGDSIASFSASHQETLGIGTYEAMLCGAIPIVPARLAYKEIYQDICYPSIWTKDRNKAMQFAPAIAAHINNMQVAYTPLQIHNMARVIGGQYFNGGKLYAQLFR